MKTTHPHTPTHPARHTHKHLYTDTNTHTNSVKGCEGSCGGEEVEEHVVLLMLKCILGNCAVSSFSTLFYCHSINSKKHTNACTHTHKLSHTDTNTLSRTHTCMHTHTLKHAHTHSTHTYTSSKLKIREILPLGRQPNRDKAVAA